MGVQRGRNRGKGRREGRCETKRAESAGENSAICVGRRKEIRANIVDILFLFLISFFRDFESLGRRAAEGGIIGALFV